MDGGRLRVCTRPRWSGGGVVYCLLDACVNLPPIKWWVLGKAALREHGRLVRAVEGEEDAAELGHVAREDLLRL